MPRRSLDPAAKPFEVKVGFGFQSFGGMHRLGDPSMCPPNRFRRLVNVRLGETDVKSRPGLSATWDSQSGEPVIGMLEQLKRNAGKVWFGPYAGHKVLVEFLQVGGFDRSLYASGLYSAVLISESEWPMDLSRVAGGWPATDAILTFGVFLWRAEFSANPADPDHAARLQLYVQGSTDTLRDAQLQPISRLPNDAARRVIGGGGADPDAYSVVIRTLGQSREDAAVYYEAPTHYVHTHSRFREVAYVDGGQNVRLEAADEMPTVNCLDPIVFCRGRWIVPGSVFPLTNPGVIGSASSNTGTGTGQQFFEVTFGMLQPIPPKQEATVTGADVIPGDQADNFYGADLTELFRLPGIAPDTLPARPSTLDGIMARSMCVRSVRRDDPISAEVAVDEKLYIGTAGGFPLIPGYIAAAEGGFSQYSPPVITATQGEVYSWDGNTVRLETTGVGAWVVVTALPDGAVLACGRRAAKMLDPIDGIWKAVTFPAYEDAPRYLDPDGGGAGVPALVDPAAPNADFRSTGIMWIDRIVFQGEVYLVGFDVARCAPGEERGIRAHPPYGSGFLYYPSADNFALYKFNRATMTISAVRTGAQVYASAYAAYGPDALLASTDPFVADGAGSPLVPLFFLPQNHCLAQDGDRLLYSWALADTQPDPSGQPGSHGSAPAFQAIGSYDGSTWNDFFVVLNAWSDPLGSPGSVVDMLSTANGVWVLHASSLGQVVGFGILSLLSGSVLEAVSSEGPNNGYFWQTINRMDTTHNGIQRGRMFLGPT